jgi:hypothetical protein
MTTILDDIFKPIPSLKIMHLKYLKQKLLAKNFEEIERMAELTRHYNKAMLILKDEHKKNREDLNKVCFKLRGLDCGN